MGMSVKSRIRLNRRRMDIRKYLSIKNAVIVSCLVCVVFVSCSVVGGIMLKNKVKKSTIVYKGQKADEIMEEGKKENESYQPTEQPPQKEEKKEEVIGALSNVETTAKGKETSDTMNIAFLGEMMMGGQVGKNLNYMYSIAFKNIYADINTADFTYANFSTNITNLAKIENEKSKYLVNKEIVSALRSLGMDCVSLASDHILDYPADILNNTTQVLEDNDIFVAGRQDMPVYFEKDDKKIAIVSTNSVVIGTAKNYTKQEISIYTKENLEKNIKEAKESADIVIADIHWGREYEYGVTEQMKQIATGAVDAGADMVIGSHALGVYPIVQYHGKPIIYSTGYLISDSNLHVAKESFIFDVQISKDKEIEKITMTPIYINEKKEVLKYHEYDKEKSDAYLNQFNNWHLQNSLNSKIENDKIVITF